VDHTLSAGLLWLDPLPVDGLHYLTMSDRDERELEFERFFVDHYDAIAQSVAFVCGDAERANDATQEAFIKAYSRWNKVRRYDNVGAWIRRIAINATRDAHRADTRRSRREERAAPPPNPVWEAGESSLELLGHLPDRQRAVAALYYLDDMPIAEISAVLDIAEGTVRFHLSQARSQLRQHLERSHDRAQ